MDDGFIDDDDLDINQDEMVTEMLYDGNSQLYSNASVTEQLEPLDLADKVQNEGDEADFVEIQDDSDLEDISCLREQ